MTSNSGFVDIFDEELDKLLKGKDRKIYSNGNRELHEAIPGLSRSKGVAITNVKVYFNGGEVNKCKTRRHIISVFLNEYYFSN